MLEYVLLGAVVGLGVYLLIRALIPARRSATATVAQIDALRELGPYSAEAGGGRSSFKENVGRRMAEFYVRQGWQQRSLRADLAILDRGWESFLTTKIGLAAYGFVFVPLLYAMLWVLGAHLSFLVPLWLTLIVAAGFFVLPDLEVRQKARERREDFRRVVSAYLDLVAMNLAGGRGLPEALMAAAEISDGWAVRRIRNTLSDARLSGQTQWAALASLGQAVGVEELVDLGSALALTADDGAKIRTSLASRAETMRRRELSEIEGKAGQKSQSMLVAQVLLCAGFLVFLIYPAITQIAAI
ncbi:type II secretion system F family protein [Actinospica sp. MGRD01-02]|uniref:Type II secretion system F family protein n=1 Tax=Actinospica acidithermotolerans TaxID=2828514 RepID=A0A941IL34_9ACTN|nr:type II secretion system F family protein [Actinospica acidithermotolerans]